MSNSAYFSKRPQILVVEDDPALREALVDTLAIEKFDVTSEGSAEDALLRLNRQADFDLVISDVNMGQMSGHDLLRKIKQDFSHIPVLLITAYASISESVQAMKEGAVDYLVKPFESQLLIDTVKKVIGTQDCVNDEPIAEAVSSRQLLQLAARVAQSESTVLLLGESGTGKEVLSKYIHDKSPRAGNPFVAINCAAIPENMLEAILFGHEKGAYTGAHNSAPGKFEQANGGTILLDEISEMDIGLQAKLLRVLQEREVERVGGRKSIKLDVRVIATSNRDLRREVAEGKFREDLYFRLSVLPLQWAPLRDRKEDIIPLAKSLLAKHAQKQRRSKVVLANDAIDTMLRYAWPGNVRELDNVMQRALILQTGNSIHSEDLGLYYGESYSEKPSLLEAVAEHTRSVMGSFASEMLSQARAVSGFQGGQPCLDELDEELGDNDALLGSDMKRHEYEIIMKTLRQENGSKKNTAEKLGISPRTLRYKLARLREEGFSLGAL